MLTTSPDTAQSTKSARTTVRAAGAMGGSAATEGASFKAVAGRSRTYPDTVLAVRALAGTGRAQVTVPDTRAGSDHKTRSGAATGIRQAAPSTGRTALWTGSVAMIVEELTTSLGPGRFSPGGAGQLGQLAGRALSAWSVGLYSLLTRVLLGLGWGVLSC